jgi:hypothetical protein
LFGDWDVCLLCDKRALSSDQFQASYQGFEVRPLLVAPPPPPLNRGNHANTVPVTGTGGTGATTVVVPQSRMAAAALGIDIEEVPRQFRGINLQGQSSSSSSSGGVQPSCEGHGLPMIELSVRKEGPNQGRKFFKCPKV